MAPLASRSCRREWDYNLSKYCGIVYVLLSRGGDLGKLIFSEIEFRRESQWDIGKDFRLLFTNSGNFELRRTADNILVWESGTSGDMLAMQADGNLVIYDGDGEPIWTTSTSGKGEAVLTADDNGKLRICSVDARQTFWSS